MVTVSHASAGTGLIIMDVPDAGFHRGATLSVEDGGKRIATVCIPRREHGGSRSERTGPRKHGGGATEGSGRWQSIAAFEKGEVLATTGQEQCHGKEDAGGKRVWISVHHARGTAKAMPVPRPNAFRG